jgi:hypothetical protein
MHPLLIQDMSARTALPATHGPAFRRGPFARLLAGVWMVVHLLIVAAVPVADAHMGHTDEIVAHWEDAEQSDCPASHPAGDCQLCQVLVSARALPAQSATPVLLAAEGSRLPAGYERVALAASFLAGHSSRAPPLLG